MDVFRKNFKNIRIFLFLFQKKTPHPKKTPNSEGQEKTPKIFYGTGTGAEMTTWQTVLINVDFRGIWDMLRDETLIIG